MTNNIKEIPLLFQTEMVQAVVEDRKSKTRRTKGLNEINEAPHIYEYKGFLETGNHVFGRIWKGHFVQSKHIKCPYGKPGDLLWVRETWAEYYDPHGNPYEPLIAYKADNNSNPSKWKPSIYMPKVAARIWLMVEEIRVERLQEISEEDAIAEGVDFAESSNGKTYKDYLLYPNDVYEWYNSPKRSFESLWKSINGRESWNQNPWVWVIEFRVLSKTGRPSDEVILKYWKEVTHV